MNCGGWKEQVSRARFAPRRVDLDSLALLKIAPPASKPSADRSPPLKRRALHKVVEEEKEQRSGTGAQRFSSPPLFVLCWIVFARQEAGKLN